MVRINIFHRKMKEYIFSAFLRFALDSQVNMLPDNNQEQQNRDEPVDRRSHAIFHNFTLLTSKCRNERMEAHPKELILP